MSVMPESAESATPMPEPDADGWYKIDQIPDAHRKLVLWVFNGEQVAMRWLDLESGEPSTSLWIYNDELLNDADPEPPQPTHYRLMPPDPVVEPDLDAHDEHEEGAEHVEGAGPENDAGPRSASRRPSP